MRTFAHLRFRAASLTVGFAAFLAAGCMIPGGLDHNPDFAAGVQQDDIPVPLNFQFDKDRSFAFIKYSSGVGSFRSWTGYYHGDQQVGNLAPWYLEQMVLDGWTHKETRNEMDKKLLSFVKQAETATITLYRQFDHRYDRYTTVIKAEIHPTPVQDQAPEEALASAGSEPGQIKFTALPKTAGAPATSTREDRKPSPENLSPPPVPPPSPGVDNKPVVIEQFGVENNEESPAGQEFAPDDGE